MLPLLLSVHPFSGLSTIPGLTLLPGDRIAPSYVVDLDTPAADRWNEIATEYSSAMAPAIAYLRKNAGKGSLLYPLVSDLISAVTGPGGSWDAERTAEMTGFAAAGEFSPTLSLSLSLFSPARSLYPPPSLNEPLVLEPTTTPTAGYTLFDIQAANLFYEYEPGHFLESATTEAEAAQVAGWKWCTSIVAQHTNGSIYHARNQDYSLPGLTNITMDVIFRKGGLDLFVGTTFAGYLGAPTAMRFDGGWSVNADSRFTASGVDPFAGVAAAKKGGKAVGFMIRDAMESCGTFAEAVAFFTTTETIGPSYYTLGGVARDEGAVFSRNRDGPDNSHKSAAAPQGEGIWKINDGTAAPAQVSRTVACVLVWGAGSSFSSSHPSPPFPSPLQWFRLETNFDHWSIITDGRRAPANAHMKAIGQDSISLSRIFTEVLSIKPVLAPDTVYTTLMWPAANSYQSIIRPGY